MCRCESSSHKSSWSEGLHGVTTSLHSFGHQEPSSCPAPATGDLVCEAMAEFVARLLISLEQSAGPTNAGARANRSQLPTLRVENCCRERQQDMEIARCVARPRARENYVEVWLAANGHRPRKSAASRLERSSSAHSCNLCIGVVELNRFAVALPMQRLLTSWSPESALWKYGWGTWHRTLFPRCELNLTFPKRPAMNSSSRCPLPTPHATTERRFSPTRFIRRHASPRLRSTSPRRQINAIRYGELCIGDHM